MPKITSYFTKTANAPSTSTDTSDSGAPSSSPSSSSKKPTPSTSRPTSTRKLRTQTVQKWIKKDLVSSNADIWLSFDNEDDNITALKCDLCTRYFSQIKYMRDFSMAWINGSTNLRLSNPQEHADTKCHKKAYELYVHDLKASGEFKGSSNDPLTTGNQQTITDSFIHRSDVCDEQVKKKLDVSYFVAKNSLSFNTYEKIIDLEKRHGVEMGDMYNNSKQCANLIDCHGEFLGEELKQDLIKARFYSVLCDGSADNANVEKEVIYVLYFDPNRASSETINVKLSFVYLKDVKKGDAVGIKSAIESSFQSIGIMPKDLYSKLIGFGADGANVNRGDKGGVKGLLLKECPWLVFNWCVAHRLELSIKDSLDEPFAKLDNVLTKLYSIYQKSPKKLLELRRFYDIMKNGMEYEDGCIRPKRTSGTRWISFKLSALKLLLDKYSVYFQHLENLASDKSCSDRHKLKGYLKDWKSCHLLLSMPFFVDLLTPPSLLSKSFQSESIDPVSSFLFLQRAKENLQNLVEAEFENLKHVKHFLGKLNFTEDTVSYQGIVFSKKDFDKSLRDIKSKKDQLIHDVQNAISQRLDDDERANYKFDMNQVVVILNTSSWEAEVETASVGQEFADKSIESVLEHFEQVLQFECSFSDILEEWYDMINYALKFLNPSMNEYTKTWHYLFKSVYASTKWANILKVIELLFSFPISNAKLERLFSHLKRVKTDNRCSLGEHRLANNLRIIVEGPKMEDMNASPVLTRWKSSKVRRPNQKKRKLYKKRKSIKKSKSSENDQFTVSDSDSDTSIDSELDSNEIITDLNELTYPNVTFSLFSDSDSDTEFLGFSPVRD